MYVKIYIYIYMCGCVCDIQVYVHTCLHIQFPQFGNKLQKTSEDNLDGPIDGDLSWCMLHQTEQKATIQMFTRGMPDQFPTLSESCLGYSPPTDHAVPLQLPCQERPLNNIYKEHTQHQKKKDESLQTRSLELDLKNGNKPSNR